MILIWFAILHNCWSNEFQYELVVEATNPIVVLLASRFFCEFDVNATSVAASSVNGVCQLQIGSCCKVLAQNYQVKNMCDSYFIDKLFKY